MSKAVLLAGKSVKLLSPVLIGVLGTVLLLTRPDLHAAFCAGVGVG